MAQITCACPMFREEMLNDGDFAEKRRLSSVDEW